MLNKDQIKAVKLDSGPALIIAGPGSGKTTVITHHINHLVKDLNIPSRKILVISFSRASAREMKQRYNSLFNEVNSQINFGTFHAVFYKFLKLYNIVLPSIIDEKTKSKIIYSIIKNSDSVEKISSFISSYKSHINKSEVLISDNSLISILEQYNRTLSENNMMDYDDILVKCYEMILNSTLIKDDLRSRFDAILIDEFQDINEYQYEIIKMISIGNLFAVGDEDQSIYGFRGADSDIMKRFIADFPDAAIINLAINYRCHKEILDASDTVISQNRGRINNKNMTAVKLGKGCHFDLIAVEDMTKENARIKEIILNSKDESIAILVRTNKDADRYTDFVKSINEDISDSVKQKLIYILFNYLNYCLYGNNDSLLKIINVPNRFIPRNILVHNSVNDLASSKQLLISNEISSFNRHINILKGCTPQTFILYLKNIIKINNYIKEQFPDADDEMMDNSFTNLINEIKSCNSLQDLCKYLKNSMINNVKADTHNVSVMTFHASKGLEFDKVIIPDVVEGIIPGRISIGNMNVEEERRLFYVAMTRAKDYLAVITLINEESSKYIPSRFIDKLLKNKGLPHGKALDN